MRKKRRLRRVLLKKRYVLAVGARIATGLMSPAGKVPFAEVFRRTRACIDENLFFTEHWLRINLRRLGVGVFGRIRGESMDIGADGWRVVELEVRSYARCTSALNWVNQHVFVSHHHPGGAAFEVRPDYPQECLGCGAEVPKQVSVWYQMRVLKRKLN